MEFIYPFSDFLHFQASFANRSLINTGSDFPLRISVLSIVPGAVSEVACDELWARV